MTIKLYGPLNTGTTTGGAGTSTSNATSTVILSGLVRAVYVKYNGSPPAGTTDLTVKTQGTSPMSPSITFLTITDAATDGYFYPRVAVHSTAAAAVTYDGTRPIYDLLPINDKVTVTISQANDGDSADIWLLLEC